MKFNIVVFCLLLSIVGFSQNQPLERPPQFVLISFDGSKSSNFWKETFVLGEKAKARFSYFISGVYFLQAKDKLSYLPPVKKAGSSDIGFAVNDLRDIENRTKFIWHGLTKMNPQMEIGSHVNGHFDGASWTYEDWTQEFSEFHRLVSKVFSFYPMMKASFKEQWENAINASVRGFRAPLLAGQTMITASVMKDFRYTYDASQVLKGKWPYKHTPELWNVGLSRIALAGTTHETIAMDYNILYGQCNGVFNPANSGECKDIEDKLLEYYQKQTYYSYIQAFLKNYYSNRMPLSIGHHFSLWNKGIYWKAIQKFVLDVCQLPEVQCVTHSELVKWMEYQTVQWGYSFLGKMNQGLFSREGISPIPRDTLKFEFENLKKPVSYSDKEFVIPGISKASEKIMLKGDLPHAHNEVSEDVDLNSYRVNKELK